MKRRDPGFQCSRRELMPEAVKADVFLDPGTLQGSCEAFLDFHSLEDRCRRVWRRFKLHVLEYGQ